MLAKNTLHETSGLLGPSQKPKGYPTINILVRWLRVVVIRELYDQMDTRTGPMSTPSAPASFVISKFVPEGDVTVTRNDKYWGGLTELKKEQVPYDKKLLKKILNKMKDNRIIVVRSSFYSLDPKDL